MKNQSKYRKNVIEIVIFTILLFCTILTALYSYLLFHSIAELFSIIIASVIFIIAWTMRKEIDNTFFLVLGISSLFVGAIDLIHTLAYTGMGVFQGYDTNLPTQLWITARYMQAFSILIGSLLINKKLNPNNLIIFYTIVSSFFVTIIFLRIFPDCFIEGSGLTAFKIISEYIIVLILLLAIFKIYMSKEEFDRNIYYLIIGSIVITIIAEFAFTLYLSAYGLSNLIGHVFKIIAFFLIYKAIIQIGLKSPLKLLFLKLKRSEEALMREAQINREAYKRVRFYKDLFTHDISNIFQNLISSMALIKLHQNNTKNSEKVQQLHEIMDGQLVRGKKLILNVRKLSEIENSEIILEPTNLNENLNNAIEFIEESFREKNLNIKVDSNGDEIYILSNELISDVLENILLNAIMYNVRSPIEIIIKISKTEKNGDKYVKLEFIDNGIGIQDSRKEKIFERNNKMTKSGKGMGLGLSLVAKIIKLYNGKIWVEDKVKGDYTKGSNFTLYLPEIKKG